MTLLDELLEDFDDKRRKLESARLNGWESFERHKEEFQLIAEVISVEIHYKMKGKHD